MKLIELDMLDQIEISGGNAYDTGYGIGYWIGAGAATIRNATYLLKDIVIDVANTIDKIK